MFSVVGARHARAWRAPTGKFQNERSPDGAELAKRNPGLFQTLFALQKFLIFYEVSTVAGWQQPVPVSKIESKRSDSAF
ncbi:MAG: hypothetical protein U1F76_10090 [Candidatus Competibacteraceae bacterium]